MTSGYKDSVFTSIESLLKGEEWEYGDLMEATADDGKETPSNCQCSCLCEEVKCTCVCTCGYTEIDVEPGLYMFVSQEGEDAEFIPINDMEIGGAVQVLKAGYKVTRSAWALSGAYLVMTKYHDEIIYKYTAEGVVPWAPNMFDLLAEDYQFVE